MKPHSAHLSLPHTQTDPEETSDFDWWSKYYYSCGDERRTQSEYVEQGADKLVVYPTELEEAFNRYMYCSPPLLYCWSLWSNHWNKWPAKQA